MPAELTDDGTAPEPMPWPRVLVIEEREDGVYLDRFTEDGEPAGDTWHLSVEDAQEQAASEYSSLLGSWQPVPPDLSDDELIAFSLRHCRE